MKDRLEADLVAWEMGQLSFEELGARYPGMRMPALADLDERLRAAAAVSVPEPGPSWDRLAERLPERAVAAERALQVAPVREPVRPSSPAAWRRIRRPLVAALAAVLLFGSAALAAPGPVRAGIDAIRRSVESLVGGGGGGPGAPIPPASVIPPALAPSVSPEAEPADLDAESPEPAAEGSAGAGEHEGEATDQESGAVGESEEADEEDADESTASDASEGQDSQGQDEETSADQTDPDSQTDGDESSDSAEGESADSDGAQGSATLSGRSLRPLA